MDIIPITKVDKVTDSRLAIKLLGEIPPIGQSIGRLLAAMRRCRRTDTLTFKRYEQNLISLENRQADILSYVKMILRDYGGICYGDHF